MKVVELRSWLDKQVKARREARMFEEVHCIDDGRYYIGDNGIVSIISIHLNDVVVLADMLDLPMNAVPCDNEYVEYSCMYENDIKLFSLYDKEECAERGLVFIKKED